MYPIHPYMYGTCTADNLIHLNNWIRYVLYIQRPPASKNWSTNVYVLHEDVLFKKNIIVMPAMNLILVAKRQSKSRQKLLLWKCATLRPRYPTAG